MTALTDATGRFTLTDVPVGTDVPLVLQIAEVRRNRRSMWWPAKTTCCPIGRSGYRAIRAKETSLPSRSLRVPPIPSSACSGASVSTRANTQATLQGWGGSTSSMGPDNQDTGPLTRCLRAQ